MSKETLPNPHDVLHQRLKGYFGERTQAIVDMLFYYEQTVKKHTGNLGRMVAGITYPEKGEIYVTAVGFLPPEQIHDAPNEHQKTSFNALFDDMNEIYPAKMFNVVTSSQTQGTHTPLESGRLSEVRIVTTYYSVSTSEMHYTNRFDEILSNPKNIQRKGEITTKIYPF